jgi:DNA polymerase
LIFFDCETYSKTPINDGTYRYASDAEVMIITYAIDDGPVQCWDRTLSAKWPADLQCAIELLGDDLVAHNAMFDRNVLRLGDMKLDIPVERWHCSMVRA